MSVALNTKGEGHFQGNRHGFQNRSDEPGGKLRSVDNGRKVQGYFAEGG